MSRGIIITGPTGSGKTTLGRMVAEELGWPYFDIDDFIWRFDTPVPYTVMYTREEKISGLMNAISPHDHFCMAGSMSSFHTHFDPLFDLAVLLTCDTALRTQRVDQRARARHGDRVLPGGDMHESHLRYMAAMANYDLGIGSPNRAEHTAWLKSLPCPMLTLDGARPLEENLRIIVSAYQSL